MESDERLGYATDGVRTNGIFSKSRISNYEQGIRRLGIEESRIFAQALGTVSATYLLCLDDEGFLSDRERELVRLFWETDERGERRFGGGENPVRSTGLILAVVVPALSEMN